MSGDVTDDNSVIGTFNDAVAQVIRVAGIPVPASGGSRLTHSVTVA